MRAPSRRAGQPSKPLAGRHVSAVIPSVAHPTQRPSVQGRTIVAAADDSGDVKTIRAGSRGPRKATVRMCQTLKASPAMTSSPAIRKHSAGVLHSCPPSMIFDLVHDIEARVSRPCRVSASRWPRLRTVDRSQRGWADDA